MLKMNKIPLKEIAIIGGVFVLYKAYELYRLGSEIIIGIKQVKFGKLNVSPVGKIDSAIINLQLSLFNPTPGTFTLRGLDVVISVGGVIISQTTKGPFTINRGENVVDFETVINSQQAFDVLGKVFIGDYPAFNVLTTVKVPFFSYQYKMVIPPNDYMSDGVKEALTFLK
tara:strand:+ start:8052 stop:8561 length:510 start_codon:yes stop_codon:yes gene_type:complete